MLDNRGLCVAPGFTGCLRKGISAINENLRQEIFSNMYLFLLNISCLRLFLFTQCRTFWIILKCDWLNLITCFLLVKLLYVFAGCNTIEFFESSRKVCLVGKPNCVGNLSDIVFFLFQQYRSLFKP